MNVRTEKTRELNDELRRSLIPGTAFMTVGVAALGIEAVERIVKAISVFDDFCNTEEVFDEHDCGILEVENRKVLFKIDYYDPTLSKHSSDPSNPQITRRVITIMLTDEY